MSTPFRKLDINAVSTKVRTVYAFPTPTLSLSQVTDWLGVCTKFAETLAKDDPVLSDWRERLAVFERGMPLLLQLASKYLKVTIKLLTGFR